MSEQEWYIEDLMQLDGMPDRARLLGVRRHEVLPEGRKLGYAQAVDMELTADVEVRVGHKFKVLKASPARPLRVRSVFYCGGGK